MMTRQMPTEASSAFISISWDFPGISYNVYLLLPIQSHLEHNLWDNGGYSLLITRLMHTKAINAFISMGFSENVA